MLKKMLLCIFALAQLLCANLEVDYTVSVGGRELPERFSSGQLARCESVSAAAVEEIATGSSAPAEYVKRAHIGLSRPRGDVRALNDALITDAFGVARRCAVYVNGESIGAVSDPEALENSLHNFYGALASGKLELKPVYGSRRSFSDSGVLQKAASELT